MDKVALIAENAALRKRVAELEQAVRDAAAKERTRCAAVVDVYAEEVYPRDHRTGSALGRAAQMIRRLS